MNEELIKLANEAGRLIIKKKITISVAESVTSGILQSVFSLAKNAISFYQGGITAYNIGQKSRHLLIEPTHAAACNCVSKNVSDQMAIGVAKMFSSNIGVGITGYASPIPEESIDKLFAFISISKNGKIILSRRVNATITSPLEVQLGYVKRALVMLGSVLK